MNPIASKLINKKKTFNSSLSFIYQEHSCLSQKRIRFLRKPEMVAFWSERMWEEFLERDIL